MYLRTCAPIAALLLSCSGSSEPSPKTCFEGDPNAAPMVEAVYRDVDGTMRTLSNGAQVPLILPPQGGKVMIVGVRATNLDGCPINISTSLRDACSNSIIALERRPVELTPTGDGWLEPLQPAELTNYSNIPACPRANLERDVHGQPYALTVRVEDKAGRKAETTLTIVPFCAEPEFRDRCECECDSDYRSDDECTMRPDAGTSTTTSCAPDAG